MIPLQYEIKRKSIFNHEESSKHKIGPRNLDYLKLDIAFASCWASGSHAIM